MTSERKYEGKGNYATSTQTNGSNPEQTAISAPHLPPIADQLLADKLADPLTLLAIRTDLRSWFLSAYAVEGSSFDWSGPLEQQKRNYEKLDELLATSTRAALSTTARDADVEQALLNDFEYAVEVLDIRRTLRVWFLKGMETQEDNIGSVWEIQVEHYELLDELLNNLVEKCMLAGKITL